MNAADVTRREARIIRDRLAPTLDYLARLRRRMAKQEFANDDPLMALVRTAELGVLKLCQDLDVRVIKGPVLPRQAKRPAEVPNVESPRTFEMRERIRRDGERR